MLSLFNLYFCLEQNEKFVNNWWIFNQLTNHIRGLFGLSFFCHLSEFNKNLVKHTNKHWLFFHVYEKDSSQKLSNNYVTRVYA
jgi:hypothetical protein